MVLMNNPDGHSDGAGDAFIDMPQDSPQDARRQGFSWRENLSILGRGIGTAIAFSVFGVGGILLGALGQPILHLMYRDHEQRRRRARSLISAACRFFIGLMSALRLLTFNMSEVPSEAALKSSLLVANHPSLIDVLFLLGKFPQADCVVKQSLWTNAVLRGLLHAADYIPNLDTASVLDECEKRLQAGRHIILFPEGTRTNRSAGALQFKRGAAVVAIRAGARSLPVSIRCVPRTLTKGESWYHIPRSRPHFSFQFHPVFSISDVCADLGVQADEVHERTLSLRINERLIATISS